MRVWGIDYGLPYVLHQDEPIIINHALAYGTGDLNPHFFIIPPACSYLLFFCYIVFFVMGKLFGIFSGVSDFAMSYFKDPTYFYIIARTVLGVIPGTLSILFTYTLYKRLFSEKGALYAAAVVAFSFLTAVNSHYAYVDNMMLMLVLLAYLSIVNMMQRPSLKNYLIAGALLGGAIGVKYNSGILIVPMLLAHVFAVSDAIRKKTDIVLDKNMWMAMAAAAAVFIVINPFAVLDWQYFASSVPGRIRTAYMGWTHHLIYSLREGMGWFLVIPGIIGALAMCGRTEKRKTLVFLSFPVVFYMHLVLGSQRFSRYALPLVPFLAMGAAFFFFNFMGKYAKNRIGKNIIMTLSLILIIPTLVKSVKADMLFAGQDTRSLSALWIEENIVPGSKIAVDHTSYRPQIFQSDDQIKEKYRLADSQKGLESVKQKKLDYLLKVAEGRRSYDVFFIGAQSGEKSMFMSMSPGIEGDLEVLKKNGIEYMVVNYYTGSPDSDLINSVKAEGKVLAEFSPYHDGHIAVPNDKVDHTFMNIGSKELFSRNATGPCIVVYAIEKHEK